MKTLYVMIYIILLFSCGCKVLPPPSPSTPPFPDIFHPGIFVPDPKTHSFRIYNRKAMLLFLDSLPNEKYSRGSIVQVDGLKFKKMYSKNGKPMWTPYPNPPVPILTPGEDSNKHVQEYARWIEDHPHFGYPPLPMGNKK